MDEAERRAEAMAAALVTAQADLASARAELLLLQKWVDDAEAVARQNREEVLQRRTLEREHAPCFRTSGTGLIPPWATSAMRMHRTPTRMTTPAT